MFNNSLIVNIFNNDKNLLKLIENQNFDNNQS